MQHVNWAGTRKHIVYIKVACFHFFLLGSLALPWPIALCLTACNVEEPPGLEQQRGRCKRYPWWASEVVWSSLWSLHRTGVALKDCKDAAEWARGLALGSEGFKARKRNVGMFSWALGSFHVPGIKEKGQPCVFTQAFAPQWVPLMAGALWAPAFG